ncbi:hypothetical protein K402DRAFT_22088 [Aulographum hederae CBS 113979]|uniref:Clr5 domain-containing protein n=1 Tax=Aulographum hederae CBS 113979 TaxID=1176131 RepID=A0A6G1H790_9PEZI|nr:hypothetical protein K402DRAFT_22088 [Aulographum hederae CBS 113979]
MATPTIIQYKPNEQHGSKTRRIPKEEWESRRGLLHQYFMSERKTVKDIHSIMGRTDTFNPTLNQFIEQFKKWGFSRYSTTANRADREVDHDHFSPSLPSMITSGQDTLSTPNSGCSFLSSTEPEKPSAKRVLPQDSSLPTSEENDHEPLGKRQKLDQSSSMRQPDQHTSDLPHLPCDVSKREEHAKPLEATSGLAISTSVSEHSKSKETESAKYLGIQVCDRSCPPCFSEAVDLEKATDRMLLTYGDDLLASRSSRPVRPLENKNSARRYASAYAALCRTPEPFPSLDCGHVAEEHFDASKATCDMPQALQPLDCEKELEEHFDASKETCDMPQPLQPLDCEKEPNEHIEVKATTCGTSSPVRSRGSEEAIEGYSDTNAATCGKPQRVRPLDCGKEAEEYSDVEIEDMKHAADYLLSTGRPGAFSLYSTVHQAYRSRSQDTFQVTVSCARSATSLVEQREAREIVVLELRKQQTSERLEPKQKILKVLLQLISSHADLNEEPVVQKLHELFLGNRSEEGLLCLMSKKKPCYGLLTYWLLLWVMKRVELFHDFISDHAWPVIFEPIAACVEWCSQELGKMQVGSIVEVGTDARLFLRRRFGPTPGGTDSSPSTMCLSTHLVSLSDIFDPLWKLFFANKSSDSILFRDDPDETCLGALAIDILALTLEMINGNVVKSHKTKSKACIRCFCDAARSLCSRRWSGGLVFSDLLNALYEKDLFAQRSDNIGYIDERADRLVDETLMVSLPALLPSPEIGPGHGHGLHRVQSRVVSTDSSIEANRSSLTPSIRSMLRIATALRPSRMSYKSLSWRTRSSKYSWTSVEQSAADMEKLFRTSLTLE